MHAQMRVKCKGKSLFWIAVGTIVLSRITLFLLWTTPLMVSQRTDAWHHMYTGVILILVARFVLKKHSSFVFAIGLGLFLDEFIHLFHLLGFISAVDYWDWKSIAMTLLGLLILFRVLKYKESFEDK